MKRLASLILLVLLFAAVIAAGKWFVTASADIPPTDSSENPSSARVHNVRYCEIIPIYRQKLKLRAEVYNTLGLNDCPSNDWANLSGDALAANLGAVKVNMNGPRYFLMDEIIGRESTATGETTTFGTIAMIKRAEIDLPLNSSSNVPYHDMEIQRDTTYVFDTGTTIFELTAPDGSTYVMQSYAQIIDPALTLDDLSDLGGRLSLPDGWSYAPRVLDAPLTLTANGIAHVLQDDFDNTYQRR